MRSPPASIQSLLPTPLFHSRLFLCRINMWAHGEDQINLKSKWALNRDHFYGRIIAAFFRLDGGFSCVQHGCLNLMSQFTGIQTCVTSISSSGPASHQRKQTAPTWQRRSRCLDITCQSSLVSYSWLHYSEQKKICVICQNT